MRYLPGAADDAKHPRAPVFLVTERLELGARLLNLRAKVCQLSFDIDDWILLRDRAAGRHHQERGRETPAIDSSEHMHGIVLFGHQRARSSAARLSPGVAATVAIIARGWTAD